MSASLTILGSVAALLFAGLMLWTGFFVPPPEAAREAALPLKGILAGLAVFFTALAVWGFLSAAGIFRRRPWSRVSIVIFSVMLVGMGGSALLGTLFIPMPPNGNVPPQMMLRIRLGIAAFYGAMTAIGVWWLVLFNSSRSKPYFTTSSAGIPAAPAEAGRPLSITIIAWYLLISALSTAAAALLRIPGMLFGLVLTGWMALALYTLFTAVSLYLGTGLLHLQETARGASVVFFLIVAANLVVSALLPDFPGRMNTMLDALPGFLRWSRDQPMPLDSIWRFQLMYAPIAAVPIWFLVRRRAAFGRPTAPRA